MRRSASILAWATPLGIALALAACEAPLPSSGDAKADAALQQACRQRANEAFDRRNRGEIFVPQSGGNSPLSGTYTGVGINRGLSAQFSFEQMVRDCVRTANVSTDQAGTANPPAASSGPRAGTALPPPDLRSRP